MLQTVLALLQLATLVLLALGVWRIKSIPGPPGLTGPQGERGLTGQAASPIPSAALRYEMLRDGTPTGHFVESGTKDYVEAENTPGLSLRLCDGQH